MAGAKLSALPFTPAWVVETSWIVPERRSRAYTSRVASLSPGSRLVADEWKATVEASAESEAETLSLLPFASPSDRDARVRSPG